MAAEGFQSVFAAGRASVRSGSHAIEGDPRVTGRWGPSIVLLPDTELARSLAEVTSNAAGIVGGAHWLSGANGRAHVTVRALEPYVEIVDPDRLKRYRAATRRALRGMGSLRFEFRGLGISRGSLMVCAQPLTPDADDLRQRLGAELGPDGWLENDFYDNGRDPIWYCSVLHFAEPLANAGEFVEWVDEQRDLSLGTHTFDVLKICSWIHDGNGMPPQVVASVPTDRS